MFRNVLFPRYAHHPIARFRSSGYLLLRRGFVGDELTTKYARDTGNGVRRWFRTDSFRLVPSHLLIFRRNDIELAFDFPFFIKSDMKIINLCVADSSMISAQGLRDDHLRTSLYYKFTKI